MKQKNVLEGIKNVHRYGYETFLRRESESRGIEPGELEKSLIIETIAREVRGNSVTQYKNAIQEIARYYLVITDFDLEIYRDSAIPFSSFVNKALILGTGIKEKEIL